ncbi:MAG TPA: guanylate kinase [bacterium]|nr:guanylate kinase [bacterium]HPN43105.1 guanylate kinase [bacterium]
MVRRKSGLLVIISSPSGGGKTTIIKELLNDRELQAVYSVSITTRAPRQGEINGQDYRFVSRTEFEAMLAQNELLEHELVHGQYYGTPAKPINDWLEQGRIVLLDVDVYGAFTFKKLFAENTVLIFLQPPDLLSLEQRLRSRSTENPAQIEKRMQRVAEEIKLGEKFEYNIINDTINDTVIKVKTIIRKQIS